MRRRFAFNAIRRTPRGFTLVELIVVIGVVIALLSLVLAVSTLLIQQNESRQLTNAFKVLESAVQEYEIAIGRPLVPGGLMRSNQSRMRGPVVP